MGKTLTINFSYCIISLCRKHKRSQSRAMVCFWRNSVSTIWASSMGATTSSETVLAYFVTMSSNPCKKLLWTSYQLCLLTTPVYQKHSFFPNVWSRTSETSSVDYHQDRLVQQIRTARKLTEEMTMGRRGGFEWWLSLFFCTQETQDLVQLCWVCKHVISEVYGSPAFIRFV